MPSEENEAMVLDDRSTFEKNIMELMVSSMQGKNKLLGRIIELEREFAGLRNKIKNDEIDNEKSEKDNLANEMSSLFKAISKGFFEKKLKDSQEEGFFVIKILLYLIFERNEG